MVYVCVHLSLEQTHKRCASSTEPLRKHVSRVFAYMRGGARWEFSRCAVAAAAAADADVFERRLKEAKNSFEAQRVLC